MKKGKSICRTLKAIRQQVADANGISYKPCECHHRGDCEGTCPACEAEVKYLEQQLDLRRRLGKAAVIVGVSASLLAAPAYSQSQQTTPVNTQKTPQKVGVMVGVVEQTAQFPGGGTELLKFIEKEMTYPPAAMERKQEGRVVVTFVIEKDGRVTEARVTKSVSPLLDAEALRIVGKMPRWVPGKQNGQTVKTKFTLPINFKL